jgi:transcriptional regulator with XRE-family HTH domain
MDNKALGERIKSVRTKRGWNGAQLAEKAGVTQGYMSRLERGLVSASVEVIRRIAVALGVPMSILLEGEPEGDMVTLAALINRLPKKDREDVFRYTLFKLMESGKSFSVVDDTCAIPA